MNRTTLVVLVLSCALLPVRVGAQQQPPTCSAEEYRQFDFWIGTWDVFDPEGRQVGINRITMDLNGCALHESWQSLSGPHRGHSYNIYDRTTGRWHQTWVDNSGLLLQLDGELTEGRMILEGTTFDAEGREMLNRITWSILEDSTDADATVRQLWETSTNGGESWSVTFDGRYVER